MKFFTCCFISITIIIFPGVAFTQEYIVKDIKSFGAKGDGKTNDHKAFQKAAAYFNDRGGIGKLIISKGIYIIGKQTFTGGKLNKPAYEGEDVLHFANVKNLQITGTAKSILKYKDSLRFGAFFPNTGLPYEHTNNSFLDNSYAAVIGSCIFFDNCSEVSVVNLTIDGNNNSQVIGGFFNSGGRQLPHYGIFIKNSMNVTICNLIVHHMALDGICVSNKINLLKDSVRILNSAFEYNSRQGLSWIGGNDLLVKNCKFNNTGKAAFSSAPGAGVDIEAEVGPIKNGNFSNCAFINNTGLGVVAEAGNSSDCTFTNCTFWGVTTRALWITRPGFTFIGCNIYGGFIHGYNSPDEKNATKFINCIFEDKPYKGKELFGNYLIESINAKRVSFSDCKFIANKKRLFWISLDAKTTAEEKYKFKNCLFQINDASDSNKVLLGFIKGIAFKDCTFAFKNSEAKKKGLNFITYKEGINADLGGNKIASHEK
ncbi:MAG: right-handed parallel beta-helix repeat-containing protein [Ginsengibacter sp.]